ncbi:phytanoyl-CoA dioxygenase family protein [Paenibacillus cremeus]|uniref:Phytanoyl-CoA dioxygenase n=1 Tax=Paenibacillus cremeus TaxID=2163881 RepID=A0A559JHM5_9BACL|nr:phytanoyl-CoA dioxygenase family protein [Paenibacillus cremeus]TVX99382.1 hypothetical protein FPZ49_33955 [Paenibacillus cremeus]
MSGLTPEQRDHFQEHGYVILKELLTEQQVESIRATIVRIAEYERAEGQGAVYGNGKHQRIWNLINKHAMFREAIQHPTIIQAMKDEMGENMYLSSWTANIIGAGGAEEGLHIDTHVPDPLPVYPLKVNSIWMLDDFTEHNGATRILPGSHHLRRHPQAEDQQRDDLIKLIAPRGSVALIHGGLWHRSGTNQTDRERIGMLGSFCPWFMRPQEDHLQIIDREVVEEASPLLKHLIGYGFGINSSARLKLPI